MWPLSDSRREMATAGRSLHSLPPLGSLQRDLHLPVMSFVDLQW